MTTNFQQRQEEAQGNTAKLIALLALGIVSIIAVVSALLVAVLYYSSGEVQPLQAVATAAPLATLGIVGASLVKSSQIKSGGGSYVAVSLGGRQLDFNTRDPAERQLTNVVEEIAIASGMPVPAVFVLDDEPAINAFAAGWTADNAAIGVTRGALVHLNRRELQGVIAHEFSHLANGDSRVKTRIIGWVFGIAFVTVVGRILLQHLWWTPRRRDNKDNTALLIVAAGIGLIVIGSVGTLFARLMQAAVSRQREFLADASAVQYTRDPSGIGAALLKIGGQADQGRIKTAHATETNHLFFSPAISTGFASHPPLRDRIIRLLPDWDGKFNEGAAAPLGPIASAAGEVPGQGPGPAALTTLTAPVGPGASGAHLLLPNGRLQFPLFDGASDAHIDHARTLLARIPPPTLELLRTYQGATAAVVGSLIPLDLQDRRRQLEHVSNMIGMDPDYLGAAGKVILDLERSLQLPAVDLALRSIQGTPPDHRLAIASAVRSLPPPPEDHDLFLWVLRRVVLRHLEDQHDNGSVRHATPLEQLRPDAALVYSLLANHNSAGRENAQAAYMTAMVASGLHPDSNPLPEKASLDQVDEALVRLSTLNLSGRHAFVAGAAAAVLQDQRTTPEEAELIRVVADAVRLSVPPLLPIET